MNLKGILGIAVLLAMVIISGCASNDYTGYANYDGPKAQNQQYVGGGCGVTAPVSDDGSGILAEVEETVSAL